MFRTHLKIHFRGKIPGLWSENPEARGDVTIVTATSTEGFAARKAGVLGREWDLDMGSTTIIGHYYFSIVQVPTGQ